MAPCEQPEGSKTTKGVAKSGDSRDLPRAARPRGGCRDKSQRGGSWVAGEPPNLVVVPGVTWTKVAGNLGKNRKNGNFFYRRARLSYLSW